VDTAGQPFVEEAKLHGSNSSGRRGFLGWSARLSPSRDVCRKGLQLLLTTRDEQPCPAASAGSNRCWLPDLQAVPGIWPGRGQRPPTA
jgi:hypothetical protein